MSGFDLTEAQRKERGWKPYYIEDTVTLKPGTKTDDSKNMANKNYLIKGVFISDSGEVTYLGMDRATYYSAEPVYYSFKHNSIEGFSKDGGMGEAHSLKVEPYKAGQKVGTNTHGDLTITRVKITYATEEDITRGIPSIIYEGVDSAGEKHKFLHTHINDHKNNNSEGYNSEGGRRKRNRRRTFKKSATRKRR